MPTTEQIREKVSSDPRWAARAIVALYNCQTAEEQAADATVVKNRMGFNGTDAFILSSFARQVQEGRTLSQKQLAIAYKKLPKYAKQLETLASARVSQAA